MRRKDSRKYVGYDSGEFIAASTQHSDRHRSRFLTPFNRGWVTSKSTASLISEESNGRVAWKTSGRPTVKQRRQQWML